MKTCGNSCKIFSRTLGCLPYIDLIISCWLSTQPCDTAAGRGWGPNRCIPNNTQDSPLCIQLVRLIRWNRKTCCVNAAILWDVWQFHQPCSCFISDGFGSLPLTWNVYVQTQISLICFKLEEDADANFLQDLFQEL